MTGETKIGGADDGRDDTVLAGEYALGLLDEGEAEAFRVRLLAEPALRAELARWQEDFVALAKDVAPVAPPVAAKAAIDRRLFGPAARPGPASFPRRWLIAAGAVAAALATVAILPSMRPGQPAPVYVSHMRTEAADIDLVAEYHADTGEMELRVVAGAPAPGRDFELWFIEPDKLPVSLGVVPLAGGRMSLPAALRPAVSGATLAISDEPAGGSPTGQATGPVLAAAPLVRI